MSLNKRKTESLQLSVHMPNNSKLSKRDIAQDFFKIADNLNLQLQKIEFLKKMEYVYNPTEYARPSYESYIQKYCNTQRKIMFLGMNPGPWGMSQTGVPFGEVEFVRDWLQIKEPISKPIKEHPQRPVLGFSCQKSEISGKRFWGLMKELCEEPQNFFTDCFVYNYLPLQFISSNGKNLPPTVLKNKEQQLLFDICDEALLDVIQLYKVETIIAIGKFAENRAKSVIKSLNNENANIKVAYILHPSPQSKAANNWHVDARKQLDNLGILPYLLKK